MKLMEIQREWSGPGKLGLGGLEPVKVVLAESSRVTIALHEKWKGSVAPLIWHSLIIGLVSLYDMFLTVKYAVHLKYLEQNPMGRWMMQLDEIQSGSVPDLTLFLSAKSIGTVLVLAIVACLYLRRRRIGHPVVVGVSGFQLALAWYLTMPTLGD